MRSNHYSILFLCLVLLFVFVPIISEFQALKHLTSTLVVVILAAAIYSVSNNRSLLFIALILGALSGLSEFALISMPTTAVALFRFGIGIIFYCFIIGVLLTRLFQATEATSDTIFGALSVYLLIGIAWAYVYAIILTLDSGALKYPPFVSSVDSIGWLLYFSFVTLVTLGYGDVTPVSPTARMFATLEAVMGQMYVAVLVARLVGLHLTGQLRGENTR